MNSFATKFIYHGIPFHIHPNDTFYSIFIGGVHISVDHIYMSVFKDPNYDDWYLSSKGFCMSISEEIFNFFRLDLQNYQSNMDCSYD